MNRRLAVGAALLAALALIALAGPLAASDPLVIDATRILEPPSRAHLLGTDSLGRDLLARVVSGARPSLAAALVATAFAALAGAALGTIAGIAGGAADAVLARVADVFNAFPPLIGALALLGLAPPASSPSAAAARVGAVVGLFTWPALFRFVRAEVLRLAGSDIAVAARAVGASPARIAFRHLLPNALGPAIVPASFLGAGAVLVEAALGFLGAGVPPPAPSWGNLLLEGANHLETAWWLTLFPGIALFLTVLAWQLVGEGLARER